MRHPLISIIAPMYNEGDSVELFFARVLPILEAIAPEWEIVCINDGSRDDTLERLKAHHARDSRIHYVSLSRNFGKEAALTAGFFHVRGQVVIPMDADLQDPPELIPELLARWRQGYKVVIATRRTRAGDNWFKRFTAHLFYRLMGRVASVPIPANTGDFRLMDAAVVEEIKQLPERTRFMKGLCAWVGFSTAQVFYDRPERAAGAPKQSFHRLWRLAKDGIFSFTTLPLRLTTYLGVTISFFSFLYAIFLIMRTWLRGVEVPGYASLMAAVLCMGGIQLVCLGIMGEYIGRIYREAKQRPLFVVEETSSL